MIQRSPTYVVREAEHLLNNVRVRTNSLVLSWSRQSTPVFSGVATHSRLLWLAEPQVSAVGCNALTHTPTHTHDMLWCGFISLMHLKRKQSDDHTQAAECLTG